MPTGKGKHYRKRETTNKPCPYSDDCFKCPLSDCKAGSCKAWAYNILPGDVERANKARGGARPRKEN